jgi:hypothetical protein
VRENLVCTNNGENLRDGRGETGTDQRACRGWANFFFTVLQSCARTNTKVFISRWNFDFGFYNLYIYIYIASLHTKNLKNSHS